MTRRPVKRQPRLTVVPSTPATRGIGWDNIARIVALMRRKEDRERDHRPRLQVAGPENFFPSAVPPGGGQMAHDDEIIATYTQLGSMRDDAGALAWIGFPYLAELAVRPEYRKITEGLAREMTRKWIEIKNRGDEDKHEKVKAVETEFTRLMVRERFKWAVEMDGYFGRSHLQIDLGTNDLPDEMMTPLRRDRRKVPLRSLRRLIPIEPMWTYPGRYNARDPLADDFYQPHTWYVQGKEVHHTRIITLVGRQVSDILKPAYAFAGLSMTQMAKPYVDNWLRTRQSVSDLVHSFSVPVLKTSLMPHLSDPLTEDGDLVKRIVLWNQLRDNRDMLLIDKEMEEFENISTPIAGLDKLQAQAQEQMASVSSMPLVVLLGITPSGLNTSTEGELTVWENFVHSAQESMFGPGLDVVLELVQLSLFGEVDPDIGYDFVPLRELSEKEVAEVRKTEADTAALYIDAGVLDPAEERERIAGDPDSLWNNINPADVPEPPQPDEGEQGLNPEQGLANRDEGSSSAQNDNTPKPANAIGSDTITVDKEFDETKVVRGQPENKGEFAKKGSAGGTSAPARSSRTAGAAKPARALAGAGASLQPAAGGGYTKPDAEGKTAPIARTQANGSPLPAHIVKLAIPPAWQDVKFNPDPKGNLLVTGKDLKGRPVAIRSEAFDAKQAASKFARVNKLAKAMPAIERLNAIAMKSNDPATRESAECLELIMTMGLRPGSETDTGAEKQAYGATTLLGGHVVPEAGGAVTLKFTGKKGVSLSLPVPDPALGAKLVERAKAAGPDGQLFNINEKQLLAHVKKTAGGEFKTKDFRTHLGTKLAGEMVKSMQVPTDAKSYKEAVMSVGRHASQRLGNTPVICLASYVNPNVFTPWQHLAGEAK